MRSVGEILFIIMIVVVVPWQVLGFFAGVAAVLGVFIAVDARVERRRGEWYGGQ